MIYNIGSHLHRAGSFLYSSYYCHLRGLSIGVVQVDSELPTHQHVRKLPVTEDLVNGFAGFPMPFPPLLFSSPLLKGSTLVVLWKSVYN